MIEKQTAFGANSTTNEVLEGINLSGKTAIVTGASAGLGVETCRALASAGAAVIPAARDLNKLEAAISEAREGLEEQFLAPLQLDLSDLGSVRAAADNIVANYPTIDILINNAGVMACPLSRTTDGFELQFGTNHVGHFLFTNRVAPVLIKTAAARVVNLSSEGHKFGQPILNDLNYLNRPYDKWEAYGQAKTANVQFTVGLDKRLQSHGVRSFAVHPGAILTELGRHLDHSDIATLQERNSGEPMSFKTVEAGAATSVWASTSPSLNGLGGLYLEDCHIGEPAIEGKRGGYMDYALDTDKADALWQASEELVGEVFAW